LYFHSTQDTTVFNDTESEYSKKSAIFFEMFDGQNSSSLISNVACSLSLQRFGRDLFLIAKNESNENSYVSSLMSSFVTYPIDEIGMIEDKSEQKKLLLALKILGLIFRFFDIDKSVFIGNFLLSTNFHPQSMSKNIDKITQFLEMKYPAHHAIIRSIGEKRDRQLIECLSQNGWTLLPARMVYVFDNDKLPERARRNHYKKDMKLLRECELELSSNGFIKSDFERMARLFEMLYIEKHSSENPKFSAKYIQKSFESGFCEIYAYKKDGEIIAFIAILEMEGVISTHMLGYDTDLPQEMGLYRLLCAKLHSIANDRGLDINFSSGAGGFKSARGGEAVLEYTAIYTKNLIFYKKWFFTIFASFLSKQFKGFFEANKL
jgi:hypothetical protein